MTTATMTKPGLTSRKLNLSVVTGGQPREKQIKVLDRTVFDSAEQVKQNRGEQFDDAKAEIARCTHNIGASFYKLGQALKNVKDGNLWKHGNKPSKTWREFAGSISGITYATVCNLISVVENLEPEMACKLGPTIAYAVARAPGNACRDELIKLASSGASTRKVKQLATKQRKNAGTDRPRKTASKSVKRDLASKDSTEKHDIKVNTVGKGSVKLDKKGRGEFTIDGIAVEVKVVGKVLEFVARLG